MYVHMYIYTHMHACASAHTHTHTPHRNLLSVKYKLPVLCDDSILFDLYLCTWIWLLLYNYAIVYGPLMLIIDSFTIPSRAACNSLLSHFLLNSTWTPSNKLNWNINNCCGVEWCFYRHYPKVFLQTRNGCFFCRAPLTGLKPSFIRT